MLKRLHEVPISDKESLGSIQRTIYVLAVQGRFVSGDENRLNKADLLRPQFLGSV